MSPRATLWSAGWTIAVAVLLIVAGIAVAARPALTAGAATPPRIEVAPVGSAAWADAAGSAWTATNLRPGDTIEGAVALRVIDAPPGDFALILGASGRGDDLLAEALTVAAMTLDGANLLPAWSVCATGPLTLADVIGCDHPPALPLPAATGSVFAMTLALDRSLGNDGQGEALEDLAFTFSLQQIRPGQATASLPPTMPSPTAAVSPGDIPPPSPGDTGHGPFAIGAEALTPEGEQIEFAGALIAIAGFVLLAIRLLPRGRR